MQCISEFLISAIPHISSKVAGDLRILYSYRSHISGKVAVEGPNIDNYGRVITILCSALISATRPRDAHGIVKSPSKKPKINFPRQPLASCCCPVGSLPSRRKILNMYVTVPIVVGRIPPVENVVAERCCRSAISWSGHERILSAQSNLAS